MRVRNLHTSAVDDIAPGAEGDLPDSGAVRKLVEAGLLEVLDGGPSSGGLRRAPTLEEGLSMLEEIEHRGARIRELEARVAELEAAATKKPAKKPDPAPSEG